MAAMQAAVFGASSGIGSGFATVLASQGYAVTVIGRDEARLGQVLESLQPPGIHAKLRCDIADSTALSNLADQLQLLQPTDGPFDVVVLAAGTFAWDGQPLVASTFNKSVLLTVDWQADSQYKLNFESKRTVVELMQAAALIDNQTKLVVIGSQAGTPGFKDEMESKEGKGAVDNELEYIRSMVSVHDWALGLQCTMQVQLEEPGLIDTPLVRREFAHFGIDWTNVMKPSVYAEEVMKRAAKL